MRYLANENFPLAAVAALRQQGHDVLWARTDLPSADDDDILARAQSEDRILLTFDKDFGDLAYHWGLPSKCGIVLFRLSIPSPDIAAQRVLTALTAQADWSGVFAVVEDARIRMRPLP